MPKLHDASPPRLWLKPGRDRPVRQRHPWVFGGAMARIEGDPEPGALVDVVAADGTWLARGYCNAQSQIVVRLLSWDPDAALDEGWWRRQLKAAIDRRGRLPGAAASTAARLVNAESDGLPGLVVDAYGPWLVVQALTMGIAARLEDIVRLLREIMVLSPIPHLGPIRGVYERSDVEVRAKEGLPEATGVRWGEAPPDWVEFIELAADGRPLRFLVDITHGHKTGWYLDQSVNRRRVASWCRDAEVLNLFSYTGGFGVHALAAGARQVENVDSSATALELARENTRRNGFAVDGDLRQDDPAESRDQTEAGLPSEVTTRRPTYQDVDASSVRSAAPNPAMGDTVPGSALFTEADVFTLVRRYRDAGRRFDVVICDPPKFVFHAGQLDTASRAYKDVNRLAMGLLRPGGILATFSCSGLVSADLFQKILFGASLDAGRDVDILDLLGQAPDHPVRLTFPEGAYLKGFVCRVN